MRTLLIITFIDFWRSGAGHRARLDSMIKYLKEHIIITIAYLGTVRGEDLRILNAVYPQVTFVPLEPDCLLSYRNYGLRFASFISSRVFDCILVEYVELAFMLSFVKGRSMTILDTHDIVSAKIDSYQKTNLPYSGLELTPDEEFELFKEFDFVIAIQQEDFVQIANRIGERRTLLVGHAVTFPKRELRERASVLSFVGSEYGPNVDGLTEFLANSWPSIHAEFGLSLNIYGNVCHKMPPSLIDESAQTALFGFRPDIDYVYGNSDIMINPIRCGAGLKIKNVEAIANGLPLITTLHGAIGISAGRDSCFLVASSTEDFIFQIRRLVDDLDFRRRLGNCAYIYGQEKFSPEICYSGLLKVILN